MIVTSVTKIVCVVTGVFEAGYSCILHNSRWQKFGARRLQNCELFINFYLPIISFLMSITERRL